MECISINELKKLSNIHIVDIRSSQKYNDNHINGALNITYEQLLLYHYKYLNKNTKYYIYCQKGYKSKEICNYLDKNGYNVVNINGGYESWILNG